MGNSIESPLEEDSELARRIREGDRVAEELLVVRFRHGLLAIAAARGGGDLAADAVQDTFAAALPALRRGAWHGDGPLGGYLATILRRAIGRRLRARGVTVGGERPDDLPTLEEDPFERTAIEERRRRVGEALDRLPPGHRDVVTRHYFDDLSAEEIALALGIPRGTVLSRLHHARGKIARFMNRGALRAHGTGGEESS